MELREHADASAFLERARPLWEPRESELNLMVGVACSMRDGWRPPDGPALLATLEDDAHPVAAVIRTPPHAFIVGEGAVGAAAELARRLAASDARRDAPSVIASSPAAAQFAHAWAAATGGTPSRAMAQRIYELTEVVAPTRAPAGRLRRATLEDLDTVADWLLTLEIESTPDAPPSVEENLARTRRRIESGVLFVWETDAGPASVAALARPTPSGVTVNGVFTPPEWRGRGYASSCVAAISQHALDSGKKVCCLYTDASNPISNAIYQRLGYRFVCESEYWAL